MSLKDNEIEVSYFADGSIDIEFGTQVPEEQVSAMMKSFEEKGFESIEKTDVAECINTRAWELAKGETDNLPYWHPKVMGEHNTKLRNQAATARRAALGIKPPTETPKPPMAPKLPVAAKGETAKFNSGGQWSLDKSNYGPKGVYSDADNARRKANNVGDAEHLGTMGRVKAYGPSNPKVVDMQARRIKSLNRKQPVKKLPPEEIARLNAAGAYGAGKVKKSEDDVRAEGLAKMMSGMGIPMHSDSWRQPTDQELFGHLVVSEEQATLAKSKWDNHFSNFFNEVTKPVEPQGDLSIGRGNIKNETLTEEEERIRQIPVDPRLLESE
jgi:hypothetical protein